MKKNIAFSVAGLAAVPFGVYFAFISNDNQIDAITTKGDNNSRLEVTTPIEYIASHDERNAAKKDIGDVTDELTLIMRMIEMSLQKVNIGGEMYNPAGIAPDSIQRIQMTKGNIDYLKQHIDTFEISRNTKRTGYSYESILNRWLQGNFDNITNETEFLMSLTSKPYGKNGGGDITEKTRVEEQQYIQRFFETKQSK